MTANIAQDYMQNSARTVPQMKVAIEQLLDMINEMVGGQGFYGTSLDIAAGAVTILDSYCLFTVDTESNASTDDLVSINTSGTLRDGMIVGFKIEDAAKVVVWKQHAGSAKQIYLSGGVDYTQRSTSEIIWVQYRTASDAWHQIFPDYTLLLNWILGMKAPATYTVATKVITPVVPVIKVNSSADTDLERIAQDSVNYGNPFILVTAANDTFVKTAKHNTGSGSGKLLFNDAADVLIQTGKWILFVKSGSDWQEVTRFGYSSSSGGWTKIDKSGNFNVTDPSRTRYVVDTSGGDRVATWTSASPADGVSEWEFVILGGGKLTLTAYTGESIISPTSSDNTYEVSGSAYRIIRAVAVTGGLAV